MVVCTSQYMDYRGHTIDILTSLYHTRVLLCTHFSIYSESLQIMGGHFECYFHAIILQPIYYCDPL